MAFVCNFKREKFRVFKCAVSYYLDIDLSHALKSRHKKKTKIFALHTIIEWQDSVKQIYCIIMEQNTIRGTSQSALKHFGVFRDAINVLVSKSERLIQMFAMCSDFYWRLNLSFVYAWIALLAPRSIILNQ